MAENARTAPSIEAPEYDGPLINGVPILTVEVVREWGSKSRLPHFSEDSAVEISKALNYLKFVTGAWHPAYANERRSSLVAQSQRRVAEAVATLVHDLPEVVAHVRRGCPNIERFPMEELLDLARAIEPSIKPFLPKKGREPDLANNVSTNLGKLVDEHCSKSLVSAPVAQLKAKAAFVVMAMKWLDVEKTDGAVDRVRQRKTKRKTT